MICRGRQSQVGLLIGIAVFLTVIPAPLASAQHPARSYQLSIGTPGVEGEDGPVDGGLNRPTDVAVDSEGDVWVLDGDSNADRIQQFDSSGEFLSKFGSPGSEPGQFSNPSSIAIDSEDNVWVADTDNQRIQKFNDEGEPLKSVKTPGWEPSEFSNPWSIAIDSEDNVWVAVSGRLQEFDSSGEFIKELGDEEDEIRADAIDIGPDDNIWVLYEGVTVIDESGELVRQFGSYGSEPGQFKSPGAIDVDAEGNVWVEDRGNDRIQQLDESGEYLGEFGDEGSGAGKFIWGNKFGIATDDEGHIWLTDPKNNRVQRWGEYPLIPDCSDAIAAANANEPLTVEAGVLECKGAEPFDYKIISSPRHGEISDFDSDDGSFVYTPDPGFLGNDSFTLHASNEFGSGGPASFYIGVESSADPVAAYSFDEGEGGTAHDSVGAHDGALEGAEWVEGGRFGDALRFNAEGEDSVEIPASTGLDLTDALTLEAWVKPEAVGTWMPIIAKESATSHGYALYGAGETASTPVGLVADSDVESAEVTAEEPLEAGEWSYLALTSDGEDLKLYIDGELVGTAAARSAQLTDGSLRIGGHDSWGHYFDGLIDEVRIYNRSLGGEEIRENMGASVVVNGTGDPEIWGRAMVGESLMALGGQWSASSAVEREFVWWRCDETGEECEPTGEEGWKWHGVTAEDVGHTFRVSVVAKAGGFEDSAFSPPTEPVVVADAPEANGPPRLLNPLDQPSAPLVPGTTVSLDDRASGWYPFHTLIGDYIGFPPNDLDFQWQRCDSSGLACEDIEGAHFSSYYLTDEDAGGTVRVLSSAENSEGSATTTSEPSEVIHALAKPVAPSSLNAPLSWPLPPREKDTLVAPTNLWGNDSGELSQFNGEGRTYQWLRCDTEAESCSEISAADERTYLLAGGDVGHTFRVQITAANAAGEASATSAPSEAVEEYAPESPEEFPFNVSLSYDQPLMGYEISVGYGYWIHHGQGEEVVERQWFRCDLEGEGCLPIRGATGYWYTPTGLDLEHTLRARIKISDEGGVGQDISSPSSPVRISPDPEQIGNPAVRVHATGKALTGSPRVGMELFASDTGVWSEGALDHVFSSRWQWQRCSAEETECEDIAGAWLTNTASYYVPHERDVGHRLRVKLVKEGSKGDYAATSDLTAIVSPGPPKNLELPAVLGVARERERFTASEGGWSDAEPWFGYQWLRCDASGYSCVKIKGESEREYQSVAGDEGKTLRVKVTAGNGAGEGSATSEPTAVLEAGRAPENTGMPSVEGDAAVGEVLLGDAGDWEGAEPLDLNPQWLRCDAEGEDCTTIPGATNLNRVVREADLGYTLRLEISAENDLGSASEHSAPTAVVAEPDPPVNTVPPSFEGTASVGETLSADVGEWSPPAKSFDFQWQLCDAEGEGCENVDGATAQSFVVPGAAEGGRVKLSVTAHNRGGEETAESGLGEVIGAMQPPLNVGAPWFPETARESRPLTPEVGDWTGGGPMTFAYQWLRCDSNGDECVEIPGATAATHTPVDEDLGLRLRVEVTATNASGNASELSSRSSKVQVSRPWLAGDVEIEGEPEEGTEISVDISALRGSKPMEVKYQWQRCFESCVAIPSATLQGYTPDAEDVAHRLRVKVSARNEVNESWEPDLVNFSRYSTPVKPAATEGEPKLAEYPVLEGWPRATETLTVTDGIWRGAGEISTSVRWQRCEGGVETCEDIEGATGSSYELEPADTGRRIRAVVSASNEEGSAEAGSRLTPPILPEFDTVFSLETGESGVSVQELLEAVQEAGAPVVGIEYTGDLSGAYSGGVAGTEAEDVLAAIAEHADPEALTAKRFTLSGDFTESVGSKKLALFSFDPIKSLIENILNALRKIPSIRVPSAPEEPEPEPQSEFQPGPLPEVPIDEPKEKYKGEPGLSLPIIESAEVSGYGRECLGDECDELEIPEGLAPREVFAEFRWGISLEDMLTELYAHGSPLAFEFDMKLYNPHNSSGGYTGLPFVGCPSSESDDFWISDRDDMYWESNIPEVAGPYWDTALLDPCNKKDITFGVFHPEQLVQGEAYESVLYFNKAGQAPRSGIEWHAELLEREADCDDSPWCVNVEPLYDNYRLPQVIIPRGYGWDFPRCYEYEYRSGVRGVEECSFPT